MRHKISGNRLGRNSSLRKATVRDIAKATLVHQRIRTTRAKAKEARKLVDRLITLGKKGTLAHRRKAYSILCDHKLVSLLFNKIAGRFLQRAGGYTRIIPLSSRRGDNARLVFLELTEKDLEAAGKRKAKREKKKKIPEDLNQMQQGKMTDQKEETPAPSKTPVPPSKKTKIPPGKGKSDKKIVGGIKKIFRRKTSE